MASCLKIISVAQNKQFDFAFWCGCMLNQESLKQSFDGAWCSKFDDWSFYVASMVCFSALAKVVELVSFAVKLSVFFIPTKKSSSRLHVRISCLSWLYELPALIPQYFFVIVQEVWFACYFKRIGEHRALCFGLWTEIGRNLGFGRERGFVYWKLGFLRGFLRDYGAWCVCTGMYHSGLWCWIGVSVCV